MQANPRLKEPTMMVSRRRSLELFAALALAVHALTTHPLTAQVTVFPAVTTRCPVTWTACPPIATKCPPLVTTCPTVSTACPPVRTLCPPLRTQCPPMATWCPPLRSACPKCPSATKKGGKEPQRKVQAGADRVRRARQQQRVLVQQRLSPIPDKDFLKALHALAEAKRKLRQIKDPAKAKAVVDEMERILGDARRALSKLEQAGKQKKSKAPRGP